MNWIREGIWRSKRTGCTFYHLSRERSKKLLANDSENDGKSKKSYSLSSSKNKSDNENSTSDSPRNYKEVEENEPDQGIEFQMWKWLSKGSGYIFYHLSRNRTKNSLLTNPKIMVSRKRSTHFPVSKISQIIVKMKLSWKGSWVQKATTK